MVDDRPKIGITAESERPKREHHDRSRGDEVKRDATAARSVAELRRGASEAPQSQPVPAPAPVFLVLHGFRRGGGALVIGVGGCSAGCRSTCGALLRRSSMRPRSTTSPAASRAWRPKSASPRARADPLRSRDGDAGKITRRAARRTRDHARAEREARVAINEVKSAPPRMALRAGSLRDQRTDAKIESAVRTQAAEITQQASLIANSKPADANPLTICRCAGWWQQPCSMFWSGRDAIRRRWRRRGARTQPDALKPLEQFATRVCRMPAALSELLTLVPKLSPVGAGHATTVRASSNACSGSAKLVRIERIDSVGSDRGAVVARATAAAIRNDFNEAGAS